MPRPCPRRDLSRRSCCRCCTATGEARHGARRGAARRGRSGGRHARPPGTSPPGCASGYRVLAAARRGGSLSRASPRPRILPRRSQDRRQGSDADDRRARHSPSLDVPEVRPGPTWSPPAWSPPAWGPPAWGPPAWGPPARGATPISLSSGWWRRRKVSGAAVDKAQSRLRRSRLGDGILDPRGPLADPARPEPVGRLIEDAQHLVRTVGAGAFEDDLRAVPT